MSHILKYLLISSLFILSYSEIEYSSCTNHKRNVKLEDGTIKSFDCIKCETGFYTQFENDQLKCVKCPDNSNNYGNDIVIDTFTEKILTRYSPELNIECDNEDKEKGLCPFWEKNIFSFKVKNIKDDINSKSILKLNQYYVEDGEFQIKYINYNGDANRYLLVYINNVLVYKDDTRHSKEKTKSFIINKGNNQIELQYIIDKNLSPKQNSDIESFFEIYGIKMLNAETSSLECQKYDSIDILKSTILNNCDFYVNKCTEEDICTFRFYSEKSEGNNYKEGSQIIYYDKIDEGICSELTPPSKKEVDAEQCSYGQSRKLKGNEEYVYTCEHCPENSYNNEIINDDFTCKDDCNIVEKEYKKIFYIYDFEDQSQFDYNISIGENIGYVEINYEKFNLKEDAIIFVEIDKNDTKKTLQLINPNEENLIKDGNFIFKIPLSKGQYEFHLKGKNLKITTIKIINSAEGGNYLCLDKLNPTEEIICHEREYYSQNIKQCRECPLFSFIGENSKCEFVEQIFNGNFDLDNSLLLKSNLFLNDYSINGKENNKFHINLNPTFPLIFEIKNDLSSKIIGNELDRIKLVRGINNRGIIFSYIHSDEDSNYVSHIYVKCNRSISEGNLEFINETNFNSTNHYYFSVESNISCPYCLDSEINEIKTDGICHENKTELYNIEIKENSVCVIKPFEDADSSIYIEDNSQLILYHNSSSVEDKNLIYNFKIDENIPIFYEKDGDDIITSYQRYKPCQNESGTDTDINPDDSLSAGYIVLIAFGSLIVIVAIVFIIWKIYKSSKRRIDENEIVSGDNAKDMKLVSISNDN